MAEKAPKSKAELMSVYDNKIVLAGMIPEDDPLYGGRDPLDMICWQIKATMIDVHKVCIAYQICRTLNANGGHTIEISYTISYVGRFENYELIPPDEALVWKNEFSSRVLALLDAFLVDFNQGQKCDQIKDPDKKLQPKDETVPVIGKFGKILPK